ncbi:MAG: NAD-dependent epimerase/dehydratase family protein, partial [Bacteroidetes bacterium]|nr:NAD-dependent epimerase/dehydratase family protein [Bacteroidota bacterium]
MKRIFLTGINGFLGSHIARQLSDEGHHVVGMVRKKGVSLSPVIPKSHLIDYCVGDIRDPESYVLALRTCNTVIHCAALTAYEVKRTRDYYDINVEGTKRLLEKSVECGIERFIHTSSRAIFGVAEKPELSDEGCGYKNTEKEDDYTKSKYLAELEVKKLSEKGPMHCVILAPTAFVGAGDSKPSHTGKIVLGL